MNLRYLGDALDHWKGSLFESLQQADALHDFAVDPMASDWVDWRPDDISLFARLLKIRESAVITHTVGLTNRKGYFAELKHTGDLFFDPDTGIQTTGVKTNPKHIQPREVLQFLQDSERIVAVYQHVSRQGVSHRVDAVCRTLSAMDDCQWCSYESATVAMMFFCRSSQRLAKIAAYFNGMLGRHAAGRIRATNCS
jgi:hypothetical protein